MALILHAMLAVLFSMEAFDHKDRQGVKVCIRGTSVVRAFVDTRRLETKEGGRLQVGRGQGVPSALTALRVTGREFLPLSLPDVVPQESLQGTYQRVTVHSSALVSSSPPSFIQNGDNRAAPRSIFASKDKLTHEPARELPISTDRVPYGGWGDVFQENAQTAQILSRFPLFSVPSELTLALSRQLDASEHVHERKRWLAEKGSNKADEDILRQKYFALLNTHLSNYIIYPEQARRIGIEGESVLAFTVTHLGQIHSSSLVASSGFDILDGAALDVLRRAIPLPLFPNRMRSKKLYLNVPFLFHLEN